MRYSFLLIAWLNLLLLPAQNIIYVQTKGITISFQQMDRKEALRKLEDELFVHFSYNTVLLDDRSKISGNYTDVPVQNILQDIFGGPGIQLIESGNVLIIKKSTDPKSSNKLIPVNEIQIKSKNSVGLKPEESELTKAAAIYIRQIPGQGSTVPDFISYLVVEADSQNYTTMHYNDKRELNFMAGGMLMRPVNDHADRSDKQRSAKSFTTSDMCLPKSEGKAKCETAINPITWKIDFIVSPHISFKNSDNKHSFGMNGGIIPSVWINDRFGFISGLQLSYQTLNTAISGEGQLTQPAGRKILLYGVPTSLHYKIYEGEAFYLYAGGGMYSYFFSNKGLTVESKNGRVLEWIGYFDTSLFFERELNQNFSFFIAPFYRLPISRSGYILPRQKVGFNLGVRYKFGDYYIIEDILE